MSKELPDDVRETYQKVGKLTAKVREEAREMVEPGVKLLDIAEKVENRLREEGAEVAFPCNISINDKAPHYSPPF